MHAYQPRATSDTRSDMSMLSSFDNQKNSELSAIAKRRGSHFGGTGPAAANTLRVVSARKHAMQRETKKVRKRRGREGESSSVLSGLEWDENDSKVKRLQDRMQLSDAQLARIERAFQKFDPDNTRLLDKTRLALVMEELGHRSVRSYYCIHALLAMLSYTCCIREFLFYSRATLMS